MFSVISNFFRAPQIDDTSVESQDVVTTHRVAVALLILGPVSIPFMFGLETPIRYYAIAGTVGGFFIWLYTVHMIKRGWVTPAKITILVMNTVNLLTVVYFVGNLERPTIFATLFLVVLATLLFPKRGALIYGSVLLLLSGILFILPQFVEISTPTYPITDQSIFSLFLFTLIAISFLLEIVSANMRNNLEKALQTQSQLQQRNQELDELSGQLELRVDERTKELSIRSEQLKAIADVARSLAALRETEKLLPAVTRLINQRFGFYHIGIFLLDTNKEYAILSAANSEGGRNMLSRGHRLKVGQQGIVGYATYSGKPRIALNVGEDAVFFNNPDLPDTHSEVALPLKFGEEIIGALDIQSTEANAFSQDDIEIFSVLADQVSVAIQNTRSLEQTQRTMQELEITARQSTRLEWDNFSERVKTKGYRYDGIKSEPLHQMSKTNEQKDFHSIPVQLRGQTIGRLKLKRSDASHKWTDDELAIIESTAERVAIALESARLLEDAQKRASRETFLSEMASKLGASFQLDSILRDTVEELGQTLKGSKVTFQLVNPSTPPTEDNTNGKTASRKNSE